MAWFCPLCWSLQPRVCSSAVWYRHLAFIATWLAVILWGCRGLPRLFLSYSLSLGELLFSFRVIQCENEEGTDGHELKYILDLRKRSGIMKGSGETTWCTVWTWLILAFQADAILMLDSISIEWMLSLAWFWLSLLLDTSEDSLQSDRWKKQGLILKRGQDERRI